MLRLSTSQFDLGDNMQASIYCPFCQRDIEPSEDEFGELIISDNGGFIYVHDDGVLHDDDYDFEELQ
jgi:hypothetical protein